MAAIAENSLNNNSLNTPSYIVDGDPGRAGGGTYVATGTSPTLQVNLAFFLGDFVLLCNMNNFSLQTGL
jgi:hypothetical protein